MDFALSVPEAGATQSGGWGTSIARTDNVAEEIDIPRYGARAFRRAKVDDSSRSSPAECMKRRERTQADDQPPIIDRDRQCSKQPAPPDLSDSFGLAPDPAPGSRPPVGRTHDLTQGIGISRHIKGGTGEQWNIEGVNLAGGCPHDGGDGFERAGRAAAKDPAVIHDGERLAESVARQGPEVNHAGAIGPPEGVDCKVGALRVPHNRADIVDIAWHGKYTAEATQVPWKQFRSAQGDLSRIQNLALIVRSGAFLATGKTECGCEQQAARSKVRCSHDPPPQQNLSRGSSAAPLTGQRSLLTP
jgi:hypothetical protein